jgi:hypothetical protein
MDPEMDEAHLLDDATHDAVLLGGQVSTRHPALSMHSRLHGAAYPRGPLPASW